MRISFKTRHKSHKDIQNVNGFGYATEQMLKSLTHLGYQWDVNDSSADVSIMFDQPHHHEVTKSQYNILYVPWESDQLLPGWAEKMNEVDEIWTPSPLIADWFTNRCGIKPPVYVYEHGIDTALWTPKKRNMDQPFKFLHVGAEASRKGAKEAMQAVRLAFPRSLGVELNMKIMSKGWNVVWMPRVNIINEKYAIEQLVQLFHDNHVYIYPSYGEGFGLTPLQALATGMPTVTLPAWAPYAEYLDENLHVDSKPVRSPWPTLHPGTMLQPDMGSLIESLRYSYENYDSLHEQHLNQIDRLKEHYDWNRLTKEAFEALEKRI